MKRKSIYQIGELAHKAKISVQCIRYYEKRKLLVPKGRKQSNFRFYDDDSIRTIRFIKNAQELGFNLDEIAELLSLKAYNVEDCQKANMIGLKKLEHFRVKLSEISKVYERLQAVLKLGTSDNEVHRFLTSLEE